MDRGFIKWPCGPPCSRKRGRERLPRDWERTRNHRRKHSEFWPHIYIYLKKEGSGQRKGGMRRLPVPSKTQGKSIKWMNWLHQRSELGVTWYERPLHCINHKWMTMGRRAEGWIVLFTICLGQPCPRSQRSNQCYHHSIRPSKCVRQLSCKYELAPLKSWSEELSSQWSYEWLAFSLLEWQNDIGNYLNIPIWLLTWPHSPGVFSSWVKVLYNFSLMPMMRFAIPLTSDSHWV